MRARRNRHGAGSQVSESTGALAPRYTVHSTLEAGEGHAAERRFSQATRDIAFGSTAGMIAKLFEHPFDLVKVRLQTQGAAAAPADAPAQTALAGASAGSSAGAAHSSAAAPQQRYRGPFHCFSTTYAEEGVRGLYRGLSMPVLGAIAENATLFFTYNLLLRTIAALSSDPHASAKAEDMRVGQLALAAAGAGAATSVVLTPIELVKCRMQVQMISAAARSGGSSAEAMAAAAAKLPGPVELVAQTLRTEGVRGLWLGQMGTLLRETGGGMAWFLAFELATRRMVATLPPPPPGSGEQPRSKKDLSSLQLVAAGALSGISYNVILFPADSVKSTMQTEKELSGGSARTSFMDTFRKIYRTKGIKGLYAGCGITCLRSAPSSALIFLIYNRLEQAAERYNL